MDNFCERCGSRLKKNGKCPKCSKKKKPFIIIMTVLIVYTVATVALGTLVYCDVLNIPFVNDIFFYLGMKDEAMENEIPVESEITSEEDVDNPHGNENGENEETVTTGPYEIIPPDADEYYRNNSTVSEEINASSSASVLTESDVHTLFEERGLADNPITSELTMEGKYGDSINISSYSGNKSPVYRTFYESPNESLWMIMNINGATMAVPLSYMENNPDSVYTIVSETETVTSYDATLNKFYVTKPDENLVKVKTVARIDAETLDNLSGGELRP